jgi:SAM-dependent methyltransferase
MLEEMLDRPALFNSYRHFILTGHRRVRGGWIYEGEFYPDYLTVGGGTFAIQRTAAKYCKGHGLDVGAGYWPLPGSTPLDIELGEGTVNRIEDFPDDSQDYVFSSHCLEHILHWEKELDIWIRRIRPGGILFLYLPHPSCKIWHMSNPLMAKTHKWVPDVLTIINAIIARGLTVIEKDDGPDHFYSFFICARKVF